MNTRTSDIFVHAFIWPVTNIPVTASISDLQLVLYYNINYFFMCHLWFCSSSHVIYMEIQCSPCTLIFCAVIFLSFAGTSEFFSASWYKNRQLASCLPCDSYNCLRADKVSWWMCCLLPQQPLILHWQYFFKLLCLGVETFGISFHSPRWKVKCSIIHFCALSVLWSLSFLWVRNRQIERGWFCVSQADYTFSWLKLPKSDLHSSV